MEKFKSLNNLQKRNSAHFFSEIRSGFEDIYTGKESFIEKIYSKEKRIGEIKDDIYIMFYGDLYKQILEENKIECIDFAY